MARFFAILIVLSLPGLFGDAAFGDVLDAPPPMNEDPQCLARKAARAAYLKSIINAPVSDGAPCPPDPAKIRERDRTCRSNAQYELIWPAVTDGFEPGSEMLLNGIDAVTEIIGEPDREETGVGGWDIDVYEIPRTLYFPGVTIESRNYVDGGTDFDLTDKEVKIGTWIYAMEVHDGDFEFAHGLRLGSSRQDVEQALGLPCYAVARLGRNGVRELDQYSYSDENDPSRERHSVSFIFDDDGRVTSVRWAYNSVWH